MMDCKLHDEVKTVLPKLLSVIEFYHSNKTIRHPPKPVLQSMTFLGIGF